MQNYEVKQGRGGSCFLVQQEGSLQEGHPISANKPSGVLDLSSSPDTIPMASAVSLHTDSGHLQAAAVHLRRRLDPRKTEAPYPPFPTGAPTREGGGNPPASRKEQRPHLLKTHAATTGTKNLRHVQKLAYPLWGSVAGHSSVYFSAGLGQVCSSKLCMDETGVLPRSSFSLKSSHSPLPIPVLLRSKVMKAMFG